VAKEPNVWEDPEYDTACGVARTGLDLENLAKAVGRSYLDAYEREDVKDKFGSDTHPRQVVAAAKELALVTAEAYSKAVEAAGKLGLASLFSCLWRS
jgi:hypothetical protein